MNDINEDFFEKLNQPIEDKNAIVKGGSNSGQTRLWLDPKQNQSYYSYKRRRWWLLKWIMKKQPKKS